MATSPSQRLSESNGLGGSRRIDGRSRAAKRLKTLFADYAHALTRSGVLTPSVAQEQLLKRAAGISLACEQMESRLAAGHAVDPDALVRLSSTLSRLVSKLGLHVAPHSRKAETLEDVFDLGGGQHRGDRNGRKVVSDDLDDDDVRDFEPALPRDSSNMAGKAKRKRSKVKRRRLRA